MKERRGDTRARENGETAAKSLSPSSSVSPSPRPAKRWIVREQELERAASLARTLGVSPIVAALLIARGYADEDSARKFLRPSPDQLHDPR
jgi:hypothetical protein